MSVAQLVGGFVAVGIVGGLVNEAVRDDRKPPQGSEEKTERPTSFSKTAGVGLGIVAGVCLMDAFGDALQKPSAPGPEAAQPQLAATNNAAPSFKPPTPGLDPFAGGPSFSPGGMG